MTGAAADRAARGKMLHGDRSVDLAGLRSAGPDRVAIGAAYALPRGVVGMAKTGLENSAGRLGSGVRRERVANAARADIAFRRVAGKTLRVGIYPRRDGLRGACRPVARGAALRRASGALRVRRVIEPHIKTFVEPRRKRAHRGGNAFQIVVADRADTGSGIGKLA